MLIRLMDFGGAQRVDMWLCGVILYTMLFGRYPFPDDNPLEQRRMMLERGYPMPAEVSGHLASCKCTLLPYLNPG